ncbi:MAG: type I secretion system permease/ATPase, partial [Pseudomonadota bacterium]
MANPNTPEKRGKEELDKALSKGRGLFLSIGIFSIFVNLLMLTGPLFMLQVYDRVLGSRSEETLTALFLLVALLYGIMGLVDYARGRVAARIGAEFQTTLDSRVFDATLRRAVLPDERSRPASGLKDLEAVQKFMSSPVLFAIFDMPWAPIFIAGIFIFHPLLGLTAVAGGLVLVTLTALNQYFTRKPVREAHGVTAQADALAEQLREESEMIQGMGMRPAVIQRWRAVRDKALDSQITSADRSGTFTTSSKSFRFFLQSAMLAVGAYLVLQGEVTAGAMIAASILLGRALAPIEQAIGGWPLLQRAREGWTNLVDLLGRTPPPPPVTELPRPRAILDVQQISVMPPGEQVATLRMLSFRLDPGQALGVIGPSAAGKSTLARVLTGIWRPASGKVRLDGAALEQYSHEHLGQYIGYLPQDITLFGATIAENIARMGEPDSARVVAAAKKAGAHEMILKLPKGYDTVIHPGGGRLSGGQRQRIGLARALYSDPVLLVLDEPNSNLDAPGAKALNTAIRQMKEDG